MDKDEFKKRTKRFAVNVAKFCDALPHHKIVRHYIDQIVRSSASVGANYRAACRAKSKPDFINKLRIVEEEADESLYFLELIFEFHRSEKRKWRCFTKRATSCFRWSSAPSTRRWAEATESEICNRQSEI